LLQRPVYSARVGLQYRQILLKVSLDRSTMPRISRKQEKNESGKMA